MGLNGYQNGLFSIDKLNVFEDLPPNKKVFPPPDIAITDGSKTAHALEKADAVLIAKMHKLDAAAASLLARCFTREHDYYGGYGISGYSVHLRKSGVANCADHQP